MITAAVRDAAEVIEVLARRGANVNCMVEMVERPPNRGQRRYFMPPLHCAIHHKKPRCVAVMDALIAAGANVVLPTSAGLRLIHITAEQGNLQALMVLSKDAGTLVHPSDGPSAETALYVTARSGQVVFVKDLPTRRILDHEALDKNGRTALIYAIVHKQEAVWKVLLASWQAMPATSLVDVDSWSALHHAARRNLPAAITALRKEASRRQRS